MAHAPPLVGAAGVCAHSAALAHQARGIKLPAWMRGGGSGGKGTDASGGGELLPAEEAMPPLEAPLDTSAVDSVVDLAGPAAMDAATWPMIYAGSWYNTFGVELSLKLLHEASGLSWIAVVPLATLIVRTMLLPFFVHVQQTSQQMALCKPKMETLQRTMQARLERGTKQDVAVQQYQKDLSALFKEYNVKPLIMVTSIFCQGLVMSSIYFAFTHICDASLPSMVLDSAPWQFDLTKPDAWRLGPLGMVATMGLQIGLAGYPIWHTLPAATQKIVKYGAIVVPPTIFLSIVQLPSALCYYWICSNIYSIAQEAALQQDPVRKAVGLCTWQAKVDLAMQQKRAQEAAGGGPFGALFSMYQAGADAQTREAMSQRQQQRQRQEGAVAQAGGRKIGLVSSGAQAPRNQPVAAAAAAKAPGPGPRSQAAGSGVRARGTAGRSRR